eukprot:TRINITY_DN4075_c0_g2_i1.p2 TRINITY_DN4075_c0_g2~~TRINITY_DN4075_c0_g2_i1.p2  ORF type:complete len:136 (+),score=42.37 TRINITY_DN4075_c0_g2_i1:745-1152(+)
MSGESLRNNVLEPRQVLQPDRTFSLFRSCERHHHVFIVGATNHWLAVCAVQQTSAGEREVLVLDSRNFSLLSATDEWILTHAKDYYDERELKYNLDNRPWRERMYVKSSATRSSPPKSSMTALPATAASSRFTWA